MPTNEDFRRSTDKAISSIHTKIENLDKGLAKIFDLLDGDNGLVADNRANKGDINKIWMVFKVSLSIAVPAILGYISYTHVKFDSLFKLIGGLSQ